MSLGKAYYLKSGYCGSSSSDECINEDRYLYISDLPQNIETDDDGSDNKKKTSKNSGLIPNLISDLGSLSPESIMQNIDGEGDVVNNTCTKKVLENVIKKSGKKAETLDSIEVCSPIRSDETIEAFKSESSFLNLNLILLLSVNLFIILMAYFFYKLKIMNAKITLGIAVIVIVVVSVCLIWKSNTKESFSVKPASPREATMTPSRTPTGFTIKDSDSDTIKDSNSQSSSVKNRNSDTIKDINGSNSDTIKDSNSDTIKDSSVKDSNTINAFKEVRKLRQHLDNLIFQYNHSLEDEEDNEDKQVTSPGMFRIDPKNVSPLETSPQIQTPSGLDIVSKPSFSPPSEDSPKPKFYPPSKFQPDTPKMHLPPPPRVDPKRPKMPLPPPPKFDPKRAKILPPLPTNRKCGVKRGQNQKEKKLIHMNYKCGSKNLSLNQNRNWSLNRNLNRNQNQNQNPDIFQIVIVMYQKHKFLLVPIWITMFIRTKYRTCRNMY